MSQTDLEMLEVEIDQAKAAIELSDDLKALENDPRFKKVILQNFIEKEPVRCAKLKSDPAMQEDGAQRDLDRRIAAVGEIALYLRMVHQLGNAFRDGIAAMEEAQSEIAANEV